MRTTGVQITEYETEEKGVQEQYRVTIPKAVAEHYELEQGDQVAWRSGSAADKIELQVRPNE